MEFLHDSRNIHYRSPFGAVETGTEVTLAIDITGADVMEAILQYKRDESAVYTPIHMIEAPAGQSPTSVACKSNHTHRFAASIKAPEDGCLLWYRFKLIAMDEDGIHSIYYCNNKAGYGGKGRTVESSGELTPYQITVYRYSETPAWYKGGIVYQIFPDRFDRDEDWLSRCEEANRRVNERRNDMQRIVEKDWYRPAYYVRDSAKKVVKWPIYGGSLRGIRARLDYLKSLGVTAIYLNPVFEASTNHRYDTGNYMKIDPALGTEQDFIDLAGAAREHGIRLILDGVFSHTGSDSIYFDKYGNYPQDTDGASEDKTDACGASADLADTCSDTVNSGAGSAIQNKDREARARVPGAWNHEDSPYRSWYKFDPDEKWGYKSWWGVEDLPEVIEEDPDYQEYILGSKAAAENSAAAGAAECVSNADSSNSTAADNDAADQCNECEGVVPHWLKLGASGWRLDVADELPDSFIRGVRRAIKDTDPEGLLIGEVWEDASNKISYGERRYYFAGDELDGTMNYPFRSILLDYINYTISSGEAGRRFMSLAENYPRENLYGALNLIGSHDRARILTLMAADKDRGAAASKVKLLSSLEYALPGVPCIYYGDEAGLQGAADPENRSGFPWGEEDHDLQSHYRMLGKIYSEHPVLKDGDIIMLSGSAGSNTGSSAGTGGQTGAAGADKVDMTVPDDVLAFIRTNECERILVLVNRSYGPGEVDLRNCDDLRCSRATDLLTSYELKISEKAEHKCSASTNEAGAPDSADLIRVLSPFAMAPLSVKFILIE